LVWRVLQAGLSAFTPRNLFPIKSFRALWGNTTIPHAKKIITMKSIVSISIIFALLFFSSCSKRKPTLLTIKEGEGVFAPGSVYKGTFPTTFHLWFVDFEPGDCKVLVNGKQTVELKLEKTPNGLSGDCMINMPKDGDLVSIDTGEFETFSFVFDHRFIHAYFSNMRNDTIHLQISNFDYKLKEEL